jgi:plasmid stabilization system protein ParE
MTYRVIFQPRALADLRAQYEYLAERNPAAATRWFNQFVKGLESLAEFPHRCAISSASRRAGREVRQYVFGHRGNARCAYFVIDTDSVRILCIRHSAQSGPTPDDFE